MLASMSTSFEIVVSTSVSRTYEVTDADERVGAARAGFEVDRPRRQVADGRDGEGRRRGGRAVQRDIMH